MPNKNALISMAYVSTNSNNPFSIFCEYIKYCIFIHPSDEMTITEIQKSVNSEFGLLIPNYIVEKCLQDISNEGFVDFKNHQIMRTGSFDTEKFDSIRDQYRDIEDALIRDLIKYVKDYGRDWDVDYAREQLVKVLDGNGLAYDIFFNEQTYSPKGNNEENIADTDILDYTSEEDGIDKGPLFEDCFFVGKFIEKVLSEESVKKDYLNKICAGIMLCAGAYQLSYKGSQQTLPQIRGTTFFFDTRLLLRFLGCAGDAAVEAVRELVKLIQDAGGMICYYPQTYEEIAYAFDDAIHQISLNGAPHDSDMLLYVSKVKGDILSVVSAKRASFETELAHANIHLRDSTAYSEKERISFGFDLDDLTKYMETNLNWRNKKAVENDSKSLWETHMLRHGNYREYCGTNDCLPVFVTTNSALQKICLNYRSDRKKLTAIDGWNKNHLPVITDIRLTCRLWSPSTDENRIAMLYLWANTMAAQRPSRCYFEKIKEKANELKDQVPEYSEICLSEFFDDNVTDAIFEKTQGGEKDLDIGTLAGSIAELTEFKVEEQRKITEEVTADRDIQKEKLESQTQDIIDGAVESCKKKFRPYDIVLWLALNLEVVVFIFFTIATFIVSTASGNWSLLWIIAALVLICLGERFLSSQSVVKAILKKMLPKIESSYSKGIKQSLRRVEVPYANEIIEKTLGELQLLNRAKKIVESCK